MPQSPDPHQPEDAEQPPQLVRLGEEDLKDIEAVLRARMAAEQRHREALRNSEAAQRVRSARLRGERGPLPVAAPPDSFPAPTAAVPITAMEDAAYARELDQLTQWVNSVLLPVYGREVSTTRPWCPCWREHREAVARLHALWQSWKQHTASDAGLSGMSVWHRDHLDHALAQLRAPDGPFGACTTSPTRPSHRLLPTPDLLPDLPASIERQDVTPAPPSSARSACSR
jgi:hypothetical protein